MVPLIAIGAVGLLAWTGYRAYRSEADRLKAEDEAKARASSGADAPRLYRDPKTGRYGPARRIAQGDGAEGPRTR